LRREAAVAEKGKEVWGLNLQRAMGSMNKRATSRFSHKNSVFEDACGLFESHLKKFTIPIDIKNLLCAIILG
jgi:hypothetical protein